MACNSCAKLIEISLKKINGVSSASVSLPNKKVDISFDGSLTNSESLRKVIENIEKGKFTATLI